MKFCLKWVHMARYELILKQVRAIWLRIILKHLPTSKRGIQIGKRPKNYPSVTLTRVFFGSWVGIFSFQMISELRLQISDLRFQISDSRVRICGGLGLASRPRSGPGGVQMISELSLKNFSLGSLAWDL